jgi:tRNA-Thr(GGU) m(6)t(6)A37 methyltransferase TsaA
MKEVVYKPIGVIRSPFTIPEGTPIQPPAASEVKGTVEVFPEYAEGLKDLGGFSHIILLCHFHLIKETKLTVTPYMDKQKHGVFSTRAPGRPNPIGLSIVELIKIEGNILYIDGVDIIDGTPLLDIKPYVAPFDERKDIKIGWLSGKIHKLPDASDDGRFVK